MNTAIEPRPIKFQSVMDNTADEIARRLHQHRDEVVRYINPKELWPRMCEANLVLLDQDFGFWKNVTGTEIASRLLQAVERSGGTAYLDFLRCLEAEKEHLGHIYVVALLRGEQISHEISEASTRLRKRFRQRHRNILQCLDVRTLLPLLEKQHLLTSDEVERLTCDRQQTKLDKAVLLMSILNTKGPSASYLFACCLREEEEHPPHQQLLRYLNDDDEYDDEEEVEEEAMVIEHQRKRKTAVDSGILPPEKVTKSNPCQVMACGVLTSREYYEKVKKIRSFHNIGYLDKAQKIVDSCAGNTELYVALMLRNCSGYVACKETTTVLRIVEEARSLLKQCPDNEVILESRCEWMLAKMYRYMNNKVKAQEHVQNAADIHIKYNVAPGEDTALRNYCQACIHLASLAEHWSSETFQQARLCLINAADHAELVDCALYRSHQLIRLAQLNLRSSTYDAGTCTNLDQVREAENALEEIDPTGLAPRTLCLYSITMSDLYRNKNNVSEAMTHANTALGIAQGMKFKTELMSVEVRFKALRITNPTLQTLFTTSDH